MLEFKDWRPEDIQKIGAPTMVIIADGDIVRPEHAVEMFRLLPHAQLAVLPGTDHMTLVNRAEWQVSMIEAFLDAPVAKQKHLGAGLSRRSREYWAGAMTGAIVNLTCGSIVDQCWIRKAAVRVTTTST